MAGEYKGGYKMNVDVHEKRRSIQSVLFELLLKLLNSKKKFASVEHMRKFLEQKGVENIKPYTIEKVKFKSTIIESYFEEIQVFTLNNQVSPQQNVILYIHGGAHVNQPLSLHWMFMDKIAQALNTKIVAPISPKCRNITINTHIQG